MLGLRGGVAARVGSWYADAMLASCSGALGRFLFNRPTWCGTDEVDGSGRCSGYTVDRRERLWDLVGTAIDAVRAVRVSDDDLLPPKSPEREEPVPVYRGKLPLLSSTSMAASPGTTPVKPDAAYCG